MFDIDGRLSDSSKCHRETLPPAGMRALPSLSAGYMSLLCILLHLCHRQMFKRLISLEQNQSTGCQNLIVLMANALLHPGFLISQLTII